MTNVECPIDLIETVKTLMSEVVENYFDPMDGDVDSYELAYYVAEALQIEGVPLWLHDLAIDVAVECEELHGHG